VIVGHLDSTTGPAVFYRLALLRPGDGVTITRQDGSVVHFRVTRVTSFARDSFPSTEVYGPTAGPSLRLITCGGTWDWLKQRYTNNVVVFADA
jgi:sortase family protein